MKNSKIIYIITVIICFTILIYSFISSYNKWYDDSRKIEKLSETDIDTALRREREAFIVEYFPVLIEPFDYDTLYNNMENKNLTKEELQNYLNTNLFSKITISDCIVDYVLIGTEEYDEYTKYNYTAYFYDRGYYLDNAQKDTAKAKASMNINLVEYYPENCKIEIPIN